LIAALLKNPAAVKKLQESASASTQSLAEYDPTSLYDPKESMNDVEFKYSAMEPQYQNLIKDFFGVVRATGGNNFRVAEFTNKLNADPEKSAAQYGLDSGNFTTLLNQLGKDAKSFTTSEAKRQKANMDAFYAKRKELGIVGTTTSPTDLSSGLLAKQTGISGLGDVATTIEGVAKQKGQKFSESLAKSGRSQSSIDRLRKQFEAQFVNVGKKKKVNPLQFSAADLLKKTLLGE
ncbi:hypothetical protein UFOVP587_51, partial [uncultured Caudovirales phage]